MTPVKMIKTERSEEAEAVMKDVTFKDYVMDRARTSGDMTARERALMALIVLPNDIQKMILERDALEPLLDSIEATIIAAETTRT